MFEQDATHLPLRSETGSAVEGGVWTGTNGLGLKRSGVTCNNWTDSSSIGGAGAPMAQDFNWMIAASLYGNYTPCINSAHIYCFAPPE